MTSVPYRLSSFRFVERVAVDDEQIGDEAFAHLAETILLPINFAPFHVACSITSSGWNPASSCSSSSREMPKPYIE